MRTVVGAILILAGAVCYAGGAASIALTDPRAEPREGATAIIGCAFLWGLVGLISMIKGLLKDMYPGRTVTGALLILASAVCCAGGIMGREIKTNHIPISPILLSACLGVVGMILLVYGVVKDEIYLDEQRSGQERDEHAIAAMTLRRGLDDLQFDQQLSNANTILEVEKLRRELEELGLRSSHGSNGPEATP